MSSIKQIKANQLNSQLSTGPTTPEGKSTSSSNSLKHGIYSTAILLPHEDPAAYQSMCDEFVTDLRPVGALERTLVQRLIDCQWRMNRLDAIEAGFYEEYPNDDPTETFTRNVASGYLVELSRQWSRQERTFRRAMVDLLALQTERRAPQPAQSKPTPPKLASFPTRPTPPAPLDATHPTEVSSNKDQSSRTCSN